MKPTQVNSYDHLHQALTALPPPSDGTVRTFRGQSKDYGAILSSFGRVRKKLGNAAAFDVFIRHLFVKSALLIVLGDLLKLPKLSPIDIRVSPAEFYLAEAMVQHYGYQTRYIDVTTSLEVALWFALHQFIGDINATVSTTSPPQCVFPAWYEPVTEPGVVYVIDAKPWNRASAVVEGDYIELTGLAPTSVNRPRRQAGGVLYSPAWGKSEGDVSGLVQGCLEIGFRWEAVGLPWDTEYLFPGPIEDPVYRRLLQAPFFRAVRKTPGGHEETVRRRAFSIPEYCNGPSDAEGRSAYRQYDEQLQPTLFYPWARHHLEQIVAPDPLWLAHFRAGFERATPIMLQRPNILFTMHRGGVAALPNAPPLFQNCFIEFSPEEFALAYDEAHMHRGIWCFWFSPSNFMMQSFGTKFGQPCAHLIYEFKWETGRGLIQMMGPNVLRSSYVTVPLELIRMVSEGLLRLAPPGNLGHGYFELTTTERFWPAVSGWTDLM
jgi:hypothetical protein